MCDTACYFNSFRRKRHLLKGEIFKIEIVKITVVLEQGWHSQIDFPLPQVSWWVYVLQHGRFFLPIIFLNQVFLELAWIWTATLEGSRGGQMASTLVCCASVMCSCLRRGVRFLCSFVLCSCYQQVLTQTMNCVPWWFYCSLFISVQRDPTHPISACKLYHI